MKYKSWLLVLFLIAVIQGSILNYGAIPASERAALISLYNSTNGDGWSASVKRNWKKAPLHTDGFSMPGTEGNWGGSYVKNNAVWKISLIKCNLKGSLPAELGNLKQLEVIDIQSNKLYKSSIPVEIGNLRRLAVLNLIDNQLCGSIPAELGNVKSLTEIRLHRNSFEGVIPVELSHLSYLTVLNLSSNNLSGNIPPQLGLLSNLTYLNLGMNQFSGIIPQEVGNLSQLKVLDLHACTLYNTNIPAELGNLTHLTDLYLSENYLTGNIPPELGNLSQLTKLDLHWNKLSGSIPAELGNLSHLNVLNLNVNRLTGNIPAELGNLSHLKVLDLRSNDLSGGIPPELGNLINLVELYFPSNELSGSIPPTLGNLTQLIYLSAENNELSGAIPIELGNMQYLKKMNMSGNQLAGTLPPELGNLVKLEELNLYNNQISGTIPGHWGHLKSLTLLNMGFNQLNGPIPPELGNLENLEILYLPNNQLSGAIPVELFKLGKLKNLNLSRNALSGQIPTEIKNLAQLIALDLESNMLSGKIPDSITNIKWVFHHGYEYLPIHIDYNALYTDNPKVLNYLSSDESDWETRQTTAPKDVFAFATSDTSVRVCFSPAAYFNNYGGRYLVSYSTTQGGPYTDAGQTADKSAGYFDVTGLSPDTTYYFIVKSQADPHMYNSNTVTSLPGPEVSAITGAVTEKDLPFGSFDTPIDGTTAAGSVPLTGWALDESGIRNVKIYREDGDDLIYIGDAILVEGARPDVEAAYPGYPDNTKAGWGYMLLTNFLPNGGSGTYVFHAVAMDMAYKTSTLGVKTITFDNAHAVKPFGAIDTPAQGGNAYGKYYYNRGWALTPMPNTIPKDGSTIHVYVDGIKIGKANYNAYRHDINTLFPDYNNAQGAGANYLLDTTQYSDGVHTIGWSVTDGAGNTDGIGSRYFTILNGNGTSNNKKSTSISTISSFSSVKHTAALPQDFGFVNVRKGYDNDLPPETVSPNRNGVISVKINELERVEIEIGQIGEGVSYAGYMKVGNRLKELPIGSHLATRKGIFYWLPGPGFTGLYRFVFIGKDSSGNLFRKDIDIAIGPQIQNTRNSR